MAAQIAAHVTVAYPQEAPTDLLVERVPAASGSIRLSGSGWPRLLPSRARTPRVHLGRKHRRGLPHLREAVLRPPFRHIAFPPHVTLVHPGTSLRGRDFWNSGAHQRPDEEFLVQDVAITAFDGARWVVLRTFGLARRGAAVFRAGMSAPRRRLDAAVLLGATLLSACASAAAPTRPAVRCPGVRATPTPFRPAPPRSGARAPARCPPVTIYRPDGAGPFPFVVLLHGCGGLHREAMWTTWVEPWADLFRTHGIGTAVVDSFGPRGVDQVCTGNPGAWAVRRADDAYSVRAWLAEQPYVDAGASPSSACRTAAGRCWRHCGPR